MFCVALGLLSTSSQVQLVNVLDTVSFNCEVSGVPLPFINWSMSEQRIPISAISSGRASVTTTVVNSNTIMSTLTMRSVQLNDAGLYVCYAINGEISDQVFYNMTTGMCVYILRLCPLFNIHICSSIATSNGQHHYSFGEPVS